MEVSVSVSLLKNVWEFIQKPFIKKAYEVSTTHKKYGEAVTLSPLELGSIKYRIIWEEYYLGKKLTTPMLWVRTKEGEKFSKMIISVQATLDERITYQDNIILFNINSIPIQIALPSIPFRNLTFKGSRVQIPYEHLQIEVIEAYDMEGKEDKSQCKKSLRLTPFDKLEIALGWEKGYVEKWGKIYNLEYIEEKIKDEQNRLMGNLMTSWSKRRKKIFSKKWLVKIIFWSKNIFTAKQLTREFEKYLKEEKIIRGDDYLKRVVSLDILKN